MDGLGRPRSLQCDLRTLRRFVCLVIHDQTPFAAGGAGSTGTPRGVGLRRFRQSIGAIEHGHRTHPIGRITPSEPQRFAQCRLSPLNKLSNTQEDLSTNFHESSRLRSAEWTHCYIRVNSCRFVGRISSCYLDRCALKAVIQEPQSPIAKRNRQSQIANLSSNGNATHFPLSL